MKLGPGYQSWLYKWHGVLVGNPVLISKVILFLVEQLYDIQDIGPQIIVIYEYSLGGSVSPSFSWNIVMASRLRAHTPRMNAFFIVSSYMSLSAWSRVTSVRDDSSASFNYSQMQPTIKKIWDKTNSEAFFSLMLSLLKIDSTRSKKGQTQFITRIQQMGHIIDTVVPKLSVLARPNMFNNLFFLKEDFGRFDGVTQPLGTSRLKKMVSRWSYVLTEASRVS